MRSKINPFPEARYSSAFSVEIFLKIIIYGRRPYLLKISPKDFLRSNPKKIHGTHGEHGFKLKILLKISCAHATPKKHPSNIRLISDDPMNPMILNYFFASESGEIGLFFLI